MTIKERAFKVILDYFSNIDCFVKKQNSVQYKLWDEKHYTYLEWKDLYRIRILDLSYSSIRLLPSEIGYLDTLECLDLSGNYLTYLNESIWNLTNLKELRLGSLILGGNNITAISKNIKKLQNLRVLIISLNNELMELPEEILELENLSLLVVTQESIYHSNVVQKLMYEKSCTVLYE